jgi:integrase/recombinase XerD
MGDTDMTVVVAGRARVRSGQLARLLPEDVLDDASYAAWADLEGALRGKLASPATIEVYGRALVQLCQFGRDYLDGVTPLAMTGPDICAYLAWLGAEGGRDGQPAARDTVLTRFRALRRFYRYVSDPDVGYLAADPMRKAEAPEPAKKIVDVLTPADQKLLIGACAGPAFADRRDAAIIRIALAPGGPRVSELVGLTLADVDLRRGVLLIREGKFARDRLIPLGPKGKQALARYLAIRAQHRSAAISHRLFLSQGGQLTRYGLAAMLLRRCALAGIAPVHPHQLRHTAAVEFRRQGGHHVDAKKLFGWESDRMAEVYGAAAAAALAIEHGLTAAAAMEVG